MFMLLSKGMFWNFPSKNKQNKHMASKHFNLPEMHFKANFFREKIAKQNLWPPNGHSKGAESHSMQSFSESQRGSPLSKTNWHIRGCALRKST